MCECHLTRSISFTNASRYKNGSKTSVNVSSLLICLLSVIWSGVITTSICFFATVLFIGALRVLLLRVGLGASVVVKCVCVSDS